MYGDWILRYPGTEYIFGPPAHPVQLVEWEQDADGVDVEDVRPVGADGLWMGRDTLEPGAVTVHVKIDFTTAPYPVEECARLALAARSELGRVWRGDAVRTQAGEVAELVMGGLQVIEGRPRRPRFDDADQSVGLIYAELPFIPSTTGAYLLDGAGESWRSVETQLVPPEPRDGWEWPLEWPLLTHNPTVRATWFEVGGDTDTPVVLSVQGPLGAGAEVEVPGAFRSRTRQALAHDQVAVLDARPGRMLQTINGVPSPFLTPDSSLLSGFVLSPGPHSLALRGVSSDGQARASRRWRDMKAGI
jgi:hypothetical protein